jgi:hypothetical protein
MTNIYLEHFNTFSEEFEFQNSSEKIKGNIHKNTIVFLDPFIPKSGMVLIKLNTKDYYYLTGNSSRKIVDVNGTSIGYSINFLSQDEYDKNNRNNRSDSTINIQTINGPSIIGSQQNATINNGLNLEEVKLLISSKPQEDRELLEKFINRIEVAIEDNQPVSKGTFAKYSDILKKYSDIAVPVGKLIFEWVTGN